MSPKPIFTRKRTFLLPGLLPLVCILLAIWHGKVLAQEPATSLDQLIVILGTGDKVTVFDESGRKTTGRMNRLNSNEFELKVGEKLQIFAQKEIRRITRDQPDSPLNGFLIGAGIGFGATLPVYLAVADSDETGLALAASGIWALAGGGIGALVDACIHQKQVVYVRPRGSVAWSISPVYSKQQDSKGIRVGLKF